MAPKKSGMSVNARRRLREYRNTLAFMKLAMAERSLFLSKANLMLALNEDRKFKANFCVNINLFRAMAKSFLMYIERVKTAIAEEHPIEDNVAASYKTFCKIIYTSKGASRRRYTPKVALLLLFAFYSGRFSKIHIAIESGFTSAGTLRNATAHLLAMALQESNPIKV